MEPIRVLCVMSTLDRGGAETMVMSLLRNVNREKVIFDFVKHTECKGAFEDEIIQLGGRIYTAPRYKLYNHLGYTKWWRHFLEGHPEYRIIHGHFFTISSVYFSIAHQENRITIGHSHCTDTAKGYVTRPIVHWLGNQLISRIERNSDYCMACSVDAGKWIFKNKSFKVLNNAIDTTVFRCNNEEGKLIRNKLGLENYLVIGNVSRFDLQKNPYGTLGIFRLVHEKNKDSKLLWVGDGPMKMEIQAEVKKLGLQNDVIFTGVRNDVHRLLQAMDVFIFPSFYEGLGIAAVEAQAVGVKTYCSSAIPREVAVTSQCHFLPLEDLNMWADEICKVTSGYEHPNTKEQIVKAGYDIHDTANWIQEFYLSISEEHK